MKLLLRYDPKARSKHDRPDLFDTCHNCEFRTWLRRFNHPMPGRNPEPQEGLIR